jgi:hypothetical protein
MHAQSKDQPQINLELRFAIRVRTNLKLSLTGLLALAVAWVKALMSTL